MNYRHVKLLDLKTIDADGTEKIDIDLADPISQIILDLRVKNGLEASSTAHPVESVSKIEIVDGSEVLFSLTGRCAQALDIYNNGNHPRGGMLNYLQNTETEHHIALDFGRYLYDPVLALDPKKFRNPQLKITHAYQAGGMNPSECKLAVYAEVFDEKTIVPMGFLMAKEIKSWSGTATEHEYTDLPTDYTYRKLLLQAWKSDKPPNWVMDWIKLTEDQDKRVLFNERYRNLMYYMGRKNAYVNETFYASGSTTAHNRHVVPCMDVLGSVTQWRAALVQSAVAMYGGDGGLLTVDCESVNNVNGIVGGFAPHAVLCIPFGDQMDTGDWYDVEKIGSLKLDITDGQTSTTSKIFLQQLKRY